MIVCFRDEKLIAPQVNQAEYLDTDCRILVSINYLQKRTHGVASSFCCLVMYQWAIYFKAYCHEGMNYLSIIGYRRDFCHQWSSLTKYINKKIHTFGTCNTPPQAKISILERCWMQFLGILSQNGQMTLKVKVNDPHLQYQLRELQDAYLVQIWWF